MNNDWQQVPYVINEYDEGRPWGFERADLLVLEDHLASVLVYRF